MGMKSTLCVAALGMVAFASTAEAANQPGTASARIRDPLTITNVTPLHFGNIIRGTTAGRVIINAQTGVRTTTGGVTVVGLGFTRATFTTTGTPNTVLTFSIPSGNVTLTRSGGGGTMLLNTMRLSINGGAQVGINGNRTIPASGSLPFALGGRLNVGANQAPGAYTGTVNITVNYQ
jgi:hypothetical protein